MKTWSINHTSHGFAVGLEEASWWALAVSEGSQWLCAHTGHRLCGPGLPSGLWRVPAGKARWETDSYGTKFLANSVASKIMRITEAFQVLGDRVGKRHLAIFVPDPIGKALWGPTWEEPEPEPEPDRF